MKAERCMLRVEANEGKEKESEGRDRRDRTVR